MRLVDADLILSAMCTYCSQDACAGGMHGTIQECETIRLLRDVIDEMVVIEQFESEE